MYWRISGGRCEKLVAGAISGKLKMMELRFKGGEDQFEFEGRVKKLYSPSIDGKHKILLANGILQLCVTRGGGLGKQTISV